MVMKREQILARVIIRVRLGMATEEERELLGKWLDEEVANRRLYRNIIRGKSIAGRLRLEDEINQTTDFQKVYEEVARRLAVHRSRRYSLRRIVVVSGAIASCLVGIFVALHPLVKVEVHESISVQGELKEMKIVKEKVMLVLGNGERIGLVKQVPDSLKLEQATLIGTKGGLYYEANTDSVPEREEFHRIETAVGGEYFVVLSDGTRVWVNSMSEFVYPVQFIGNRRVVQLKGEAYFEVKHDPARPFIVQVRDVETRVLGTAFNISAYENEESVYTTLLTGKVQVSLMDQKSDIPSMILKLGMQSCWKKGTGEFSVRKVDTKNVVAWRYGEFVFDEDDIEVVTRMLSRWYEVRFVYDGKRKGRHTFSGKMSKDEKLESILKMLTLAGGPEFRMEDGIVHIVEKR